MVRMRSARSGHKVRDRREQGNRAEWNAPRHMLLRGALRFARRVRVLRAWQHPHLALRAVLSRKRAR